MNILVSACLLGACCKYSGGSNLCPELAALARPENAARFTLIPVCPELYGGLPTPRPPAERRGSRVVACTGADVTEQYLRGAQETLALAKLYGCRAAILKTNSPSCGHGAIYDGSFTGKKIPGDGVAAALLLEHGVAVYNEENFRALLEG